MDIIKGRSIKTTVGSFTNIETNIVATKTAACNVHSLPAAALKTHLFTDPPQRDSVLFSEVNQISVPLQIEARWEE